MPKRKLIRVNLLEVADLLWDVLPVDDDLEDELPEPVGGHEEVALLPPVLAPGVLHPPPRHAPVLLHVAPSQHLRI
jgi:hypothetical protein